MYGGQWTRHGAGCGAELKFGCDCGWRGGVGLRSAVTSTGARVRGSDHGEGPLKER
jgi:hypothetical protein